VVDPGIPLLNEREMHFLRVVCLLIEQLGGSTVITEQQWDAASKKQFMLRTYYDPFKGGDVYEIKEPGEEADTERN
jgi:hypothetical protein